MTSSSLHLTKNMYEKPTAYNGERTRQRYSRSSCLHSKHTGVLASKVKEWGGSTPIGNKDLKLSSLINDMVVYANKKQKKTPKNL